MTLIVELLYRECNYFATEQPEKFGQKSCKNLLHFALKSGNISTACLSVISEFICGKEVQPVAKCDICGKGVTFGIKVSHSHRRSNRMWKPNVKRVKAIVDGTPRHVYVCTRCLRSNKVERAV